MRVSVRPVAACAALAVCLSLTGCGEKHQSVEVIKPTKKSVEETPRRRNGRSASSAGQAPVPPAPTATPKPPPGVKVLAATAMPNTAAKPDPDGGMFLPFNGQIQIDNYEIGFPVREVTVEMKGTPANSVWPEVVLSAYNRTTQKNYDAMPKTYATSADYQTFRFPQKTVLEPGTYLITFRFLNNLDIPETGEDRSVWLRNIEFHEEPQD